MAVAFTGGDLLSARPLDDVPIEGIDLPTGSFVMPVGHRARIRIALGHTMTNGGTLPAVPVAAQVARGWVALAARASRFVLPEGDNGESQAQRVVTERCELVLNGPGDVVDPALFLLGLAELVRLGEAPAGARVDDAAGAVEAIAADDAWETAVALMAAARLLEAAGEARAVRDIDRIVADRPPVSPPDSVPDGLFVVPWLESQFAVGGALFPRGIPTAWRGQPIEAHGIPTGAGSSISLAAPVGENGRPHPGLQGHPGGKPQRGRIRDIDAAGAAVERKRGAVLARRAPDGVGGSLRRCRCRRRPRRSIRSLIESVSSHQAGCGRGGSIADGYRNHRAGGLVAGGVVRGR